METPEKDVKTAIIKPKGGNLTSKRDKLTPKQELFCKLYATDREFFGNGVQSYIEAYNPSRSKPGWYNSARATVSEILTNPNILKRINELLDTEGFNDANVDKQHLFLIQQNADMKTKMSAIKEYNSLKRRTAERITETKTMKMNLTQNNFYGSELLKEAAETLGRDMYEQV